MKYRKLRIAWSVGWGIIAVMLIALWVRSYWWVDGLGVPLTSKYYLGAGSNPGCIGFTLTPMEQLSSGEPRVVPTQPAEIWLWAVRRAKLFNISRVWGTLYVGEFGYMAPDWLLLLFAATLAATPWFPFRFSLRTLLITTTLMAVLLGLIVWAAR